NIAFTRDRTPKLLDFGLAGLIERAQPALADPALAGASMLSTTLAGTVPYLPPQAFAAAPPTIQFDLWALAVVLFEAVVGQHPFVAGADTPHNICRGRFVVPIDGSREVPRPVAEFLRVALRPGPTPPFHSATAMRDALRAARVAL
ncbi:MAG TPA: hypothetical protein VNG89_13965, partial [Vicinamibacterales bacterium]|nr:hypothetical protein [Vicinamibacterales bacterium]